MDIPFLLSPSDVCRLGLKFFDEDADAKTKDLRNLNFFAYFGANPVVLAAQWYDLCAKNIVKEHEKDEEGFRSFLIAHFFLWTYPKNSRILANHFKRCKRYCSGAHLWNWVEKISLLKAHIIVWDKDLDDTNGDTFILSVDGIDFRCWERKHPLMNIDRRQYSKNFNHGAVKYEVGMSLSQDKCV